MGTAVLGRCADPAAGVGSGQGGICANCFCFAACRFALNSCWLSGQHCKFRNKVANHGHR